MSGFPDIDRRFDYHPSNTPDRVATHEKARAAVKAAALALVEVVPPGRECALALTALEEALYWANAGIARPRSHLSQESDMAHRATPTNPTQSKHPWRAVIRTVFAFVVGVAPMIPGLVAASGVSEASPWVAGAIAASAAVTRFLASPAVNALLATYVPWLAAEPASVQN